MPRKPTDLTGRRFGLLTVLEITDDRTSDGRRRYLCRCDCGNQHLVTYGDLTSGKVTSCGCKARGVKKDLTGQRFGRLTVLSVHSAPTDRKSTTYKWLCRCDCGKTTVVSANALLTGKRRSCGCLQVDAVKSLYTDGTAPCKLRESAKPRATNSSGVTGVWYDKRRAKWCAELMLRGKKYYLGRYDKIEDAIAARKAGEQRYFGDYID